MNVYYHHFAGLKKSGSSSKLVAERVRVRVAKRRRLTRERQRGRRMPQKSLSHHEHREKLGTSE